MKAYVNENCIGCGVCVNLCPEVFYMTDQGTAKAVNEDITDKKKQAIEAHESCPVDAIEIE